MKSIMICCRKWGALFGLIAITSLLGACAAANDASSTSSSSSDSSSYSGNVSLSGSVYALSSDVSQVQSSASQALARLSSQRISEASTKDFGGSQAEKISSGTCKLKVYTATGATEETGIESSITDGTYKFDVKPNQGYVVSCETTGKDSQGKENKLVANSYAFVESSATAVSQDVDPLSELLFDVMTEVVKERGLDISGETIQILVEATASALSTKLSSNALSFTSQVERTDGSTATKKTREELKRKDVVDGIMKEDKSFKAAEDTLKFEQMKASFEDGTQTLADAKRLVRECFDVASRRSKDESQIPEFYITQIAQAYLDNKTILVSKFVEVYINSLASELSPLKTVWAADNFLETQIISNMQTKLNAFYSTFFDDTGKLKKDSDGNLIIDQIENFEKFDKLMLTFPFSEKDKWVGSDAVVKDIQMTPLQFVLSWSLSDLEDLERLQDCSSSSIIPSAQQSLCSSYLQIDSSSRLDNFWDPMYLMLELDLVSISATDSLPNINDDYVNLRPVWDDATNTQKDAFEAHLHLQYHAQNTGFDGAGAAIVYQKTDGASSTITLSACDNAHGGPDEEAQFKNLEFCLSPEYHDSSSGQYGINTAALASNFDSTKAIQVKLIKSDSTEVLLFERTIRRFAMAPPNWVYPGPMPDFAQGTHTDYRPESIFTDDSSVEVTLEWSATEPANLGDDLELRYAVFVHETAIKVDIEGTHHVDDFRNKPQFKDAVDALKGHFETTNTAFTPDNMAIEKTSNANLSGVDFSNLPFDNKDEFLHYVADNSHVMHDVMNTHMPTDGASTTTYNYHDDQMYNPDFISAPEDMGFDMGDMGYGNDFHHSKEIYNSFEDDEFLDETQLDIELSTKAFDEAQGLEIRYMVEVEPLVFEKGTDHIVWSGPRSFSELVILPDNMFEGDKKDHGFSQRYDNKYSADEVNTINLTVKLNIEDSWLEGLPTTGYTWRIGIFKTMKFPHWEPIFWELWDSNSEIVTNQAAKPVAVKEIGSTFTVGDTVTFDPILISDPSSSDSVLQRDGVYQIFLWQDEDGAGKSGQIDLDTTSNWYSEFFIEGFADMHFPPHKTNIPEYILWNQYGTPTDVKGAIQLNIF